MKDFLFGLFVFGVLMGMVLLAELIAPTPGSPKG